jgi:hypothetical protein
MLNLVSVKGDSLQPPEGKSMRSPETITQEIAVVSGQVNVLSERLNALARELQQSLQLRSEPIIPPLILDKPPLEFDDVNKTITSNGMEINMGKGYFPLKAAYDAFPNGISFTDLGDLLYRESGTPDNSLNRIVERVNKNLRNVQLNIFLTKKRDFLFLGVKQY